MTFFLRPSYGGFRARPRGNIAVALILVLVAFVSYCSTASVNPITGERQYVALSPEEEIALGLHSAPVMAERHGGQDPDPRAGAQVRATGMRLVKNSAAAKTDWQYDFHLLADRRTVNAFALPGGQIFITRALYDRLKTEGQLAGVLGHEIAHVIARHGAQQLAKQQLTQGLTGAVVVASGSYDSGQMAAVVGQLVNMRYGREDELESDRLGVQLMAEAGYDPGALVTVMAILRRAGGRNGPPEFFSTHPDPENRVGEIKRAISERFPNGVPAGLTK